MITSKPLYKTSFTKLLFLLFIISFATASTAQINRTKTEVGSPVFRRAITDTAIRKIKVNDRVDVDERMMNVNIYGTTDTVWDLKPYIQTKATCDFVKTIEEDGCILVTYSDGFKKQICNGEVIEVTLANGKKYHKRAGPSLRHLVMRIPVPNPTGTETAYNWLVSYNAALLNDIKEYLVTDLALNTYLANEKAVCKGMFYKQIDYRTIFIQEFLKAK
jgi:hypothetical protein